MASSFGVIASMLQQNHTKAFLFYEKICGQVCEFRYPGRSQKVVVGYYIIVYYSYSYLLAGCYNYYITIGKFLFFSTSRDFALIVFTWVTSFTSLLVTY